MNQFHIPQKLRQIIPNNSCQFLQYGRSQNNTEAMITDYQQSVFINIDNQVSDSDCHFCSLDVKSIKLYQKLHEVSEQLTQMKTKVEYLSTCYDASEVNLENMHGFQRKMQLYMTYKLRKQHSK
ncbi:Hypothetical_protein [Hexamita inflata]|uniref:Hypothetical_protein n=1 Tax=Hexamita inflata TaxID=28002 RepID=A0AA86NXA1_9EUKA|nr:Hypothetical protein HINF_LOCUS14036 [Hexamita inflata]